MAVKKATSRTPSTTKRGKTTKSTAKSTTKRSAKPRSAASAAKAAPAEQTATSTMRRVETVETIERAPATYTSATDARPSHFTGEHYLRAAGPPPAEGSARRPGKWLMFVARSRVDALWDQIRRAVEAGRLGHAAKVSTALPDPLSPDPKKHVICVYTANEDDAPDVRRVRNELRQLGVTWKIPYKSDAAGGAGQYEWTGGPAAKYYE